MRRLLSLFLLLVLAGLTSCTTPVRQADAGPVILISIDGFRWDYLDKFNVPTLRRLADAGVHARRLNPIFPSRTFPNHYALVTGLYAEHHGMVNNTFHDPVLGRNFAKGDSATVWWDQGEPIWITAEKQGVRTACYIWPGSEAEIQGRRPSDYMKFTRDSTATDRVDGVLAWLARPEAERPRFITLYFDQVDIAGHPKGPEAPETAATAAQIDAALARLLAGLEKLGLRDKANLVIVSDHGLSETSTERVVFFEDLMDTSLVSIEATGPHGGVRPKPDVDLAALVASIRAKAPAQVQVYSLDDRPARLHYRDNPRIPPILFVMDDGWCIESKVGWAALKNKLGLGNHGWDPATPNMGALFVASGPAFRPNVRLSSADNIDVYNLLCALLGIKAAPNDGSDALARAALRR
jgi:predicted AlkP superfamily pyrophosphatase or phosphodiesterase